MMSEATRALIYRVVTALLAVATVYGFVNADQEAAIVALVGALTTLLASFNTSMGRGGDGGDES
jgi:amino acid permease